MCTPVQNFRKAPSNGPYLAMDLQFKIITLLCHPKQESAESQKPISVLTRAVNRLFLKRRENDGHPQLASENVRLPAGVILAPQALTPSASASNGLLDRQKQPAAT